VPDTSSRLARWTPLALAAAVPALLFFVLPPLSQSGMWDPYELNVADLSRRIALQLLHAGDLALAGADNTLPHLNDLGRPQLPFTSIALGFRLFGLHEWAGRFPLAVWGVAGVLATYAFVARLFDRRTGAYAAVALATMPLYFVQARTMLGDVCTMAGLAMAFGGLAVAAFDRDEDGPTSLARRAPWLALGALGLLVGLESRGGLLGLAVPLMGVGVAWAATRVAAPARQRDTTGDVVGVLSLLAGAGVTVMAVRALTAPLASKDLDLWLGATLHAPPHYPTHEAYIGAVGHALAPWSAFLPFAFGRLLLVPTGRTGAAGERESVARVALLVGAAVALAAHGLLAPHTEAVAFTGPALCAAACAVAIRDFERGARASIAVGLGTLLLAAILHHDFHELPEKAYLAFGVSGAGATFPEAFKPTALTLWWVVLGGFAVCAFLTWVERDPKRAPFDPATYGRLLRALREAYDGVLALVYAAALLGAVLAGLFILVGMKTHARWLPPVSTPLRDLALNAWWVLTFAPLGLIFGTLFACDIWLWTFERSHSPSLASATRGLEPHRALWRRLGGNQSEGAPGDAYETLAAWVILAPMTLLATPVLLVMGPVGDLLRHRAPALALAGGVVGFVLCFFYYPALANQLSPKQVFESYRRECPHGELGLLGVGGRTAAYYAGGEPGRMNDAVSALRWLGTGRSEPRCLAMKADELPKLNSLWRERAAKEGLPVTNLPVLDGRSSQILLAASALEPGQRNDNPLERVVLSTTPHPGRPLAVNLDDQLEVLGMDTLDEHGRAVDAVSPGRPYHLLTYYRVLAHVPTEWQAFLHIDGSGRRHNDGDHKPLDGKYPMALWQPGDVLVDDHELTLEPNFSAGNYTLWFGLAVGDKCTERLRVKSGASDGCNRINGGVLRVQ
jgi:4-amino-4-deoxy-L-arabinose transferase-like glycosyltransferase